MRVKPLSAGALVISPMFGVAEAAQAKGGSGHPESSCHHRARIRLLRALCSTSAKPRASSTGGT